jgi:small subunit ribosomal protein S6
MRDYELTYIVHPEVDEEGLAALAGEVQSLVESTGGTIRQVRSWGLRRLAYPIQKAREGYYVLLVIGMQPQGIAELERGLGLREPIIRHLLVRVEEEQVQEEQEQVEQEQVEQEQEGQEQEGQEQEGDEQRAE